MTDQVLGSQAAVQFTGVLLESRVVKPIGEIPGLDLHIGPGGIFMISAATRSTQSVEYLALSDVRCGDLASLPDGSPAMAMSAVVAGRPLRWLIPAAQLPASSADALASLVRQRVEAARGASAAHLAAVVPPPIVSAPASELPTWASQVAQRGSAPVPEDAPWAPAPELPIRAGQPEQSAWAPAPLWPGSGFEQPGSVQPGFVEPYGSAPTAARARRRFGPLLWTLVGAEVLLVAAAIVIPIAAQAPAPRPAPGGAAFADRQLARQINLQPSDLPATWTVDRASNGPLSGFLGASTSNAAPTKQDTHLADQVAAQFEQCMGIAPSEDRIFGPAGSTPTASSSSPAFAAPSDSPGQAAGAEEAGSSVDVYPSTTEVAADLAQIADAKFPACFGAALGTSFVGAATSGGSGDQVGQPQVQPITVPQRQGVTSSGVEVTIPLTTQGTTVPVQFGVVLIGGDRVEATLFTFSEATPFPSTLTSSLSLTLADNIVAEGVGTAT